MISGTQGLVILLGLFIFKHFVADFVLQNDRHIEGKYVYGRWNGIEHSLHHGVLTFCVLIPFTTALMAIVMAAIDLFLHYHIDYFKVRFGPRDSRKHSYWVWFGADQMLHYLTYLAIVFKLQ